MKNFNTWIIDPFRSDLVTGMSMKTDEELIDLSPTVTFDRKILLQFWLSIDSENSSDFKHNRFKSTSQIYSYTSSFLALRNIPAFRIQ